MSDSLKRFIFSMQAKKFLSRSKTHFLTAFFSLAFLMSFFYFAENLGAQQKTKKAVSLPQSSAAEKKRDVPQKFPGLPKPKDSVNEESAENGLPNLNQESDDFPASENLDDALIDSLPLPNESLKTEENSSADLSKPRTKESSGSGNLTWDTLLEGPDAWMGSEGILSSSKMVILLTILSLAPAILMMTTSYVRIITVLSILRQGLGTGQIPSTQVLAAVSLFLSLLIMWPTWNEVYQKGILPYSRQEIDEKAAFEAGTAPIRTFLWKQIEKTGNTESIWLLMSYIPDAEKPEYYEDIPWRALLPAFILSELKTAFLIGFQLLLPFLVVDLVVSGIMVSMGMMMIPPTIVALPFKLMLFVLLDGWTLIVKMLLDSFMISG